MSSDDILLLPVIATTVVHLMVAGVVGLRGSRSVELPQPTIDILTTSRTYKHDSQLTVSYTHLTLPTIYSV